MKKDKEKPWDPKGKGATSGLMAKDAKGDEIIMVGARE